LRVWGGYAPSPTFRLFLRDGRRVFFKGVNPTSNEHMHTALTAEERVYRELPAWIRPWAPAFLDSFHCADWHVLLLEDVAGTRVPPWTPRRVQSPMHGYAAFHRHSLGLDLPGWWHALVRLAVRLRRSSRAGPGCIRPEHHLRRRPGPRQLRRSVHAASR